MYVNQIDSLNSANKTLRSENVEVRRKFSIANDSVKILSKERQSLHESQTLENVVAARAKATQITVDPSNLTPEKLKEYQAAQGELTSALGKLIALKEAYPDLKANQNFLELQAQLEGTENRIANERMKFNETAQAYNAKIRKFPTSIVAGIGGFQQKPYFEAEAGADKAPKVQF